MHPYIGTILLFGLAVAEFAQPGWNGMFADQTSITEEGSRIIMSVYVTGGIVLLFLSDRLR